LNLKEKVFNSSIWFGFSKIVSSFTSLILNIFLARILVPKDFGVFAIVTLSIGFISIISNIGFGDSLIQKEKTNSSQMSSLFWINIFTSFLTTVLIYSLAYPISHYYGNPDLAILIKIMSIEVIISSFFIFHKKMLQKEIDFKTLSIIDMFLNIFGVSFSIIAAFNGAGIYSLICFPLSKAIMSVFVFPFFYNWKPELILEFHDISDHIVYSLKTKLSYVFIYIERNLDTFILSSFFSEKILGYYSLSFSLIYLPVKKISHTLTHILFPTFSLIKNDYQKIKQWYLSTFKILSIITFPLCSFFFSYSNEIIVLIFSEKWIPASDILRALSFIGAMQSINIINTPLLNAVGKPELNIYFGIFKSIFLSISLLIASRYGIIIFCYVVLINKVINFFIITLINKRLFNINYYELFLSIIGSIIFSTLIYVSSVFKSIYVVYNLPITSALIIIFGLSILYKFHDQDFQKIFELIKKNNK